MPTTLLESSVDATAEQLFDWHARPGAIYRLLPPWQDVKVIRGPIGLDAGQTVILEMSLLGPVRGRWEAEHTWCERPVGFDDVQRSGPFARWHHRHRFADGQLTDAIDWAPPLLARPFTGRLEADLMKGFRLRHQRTREDLARHARTDRPWVVAVSGASGLVGTALTHFLTSGGHEVRPLVRRGGDGIAWDPARGTLDAAALEGVDAVVHLAGAGIAEGRWTDDRKALIRDSRVDGTALLAGALAKLARPPSVFVSGSAVGVYGDRGDEPLDEASPGGTGFLADVGAAWEAAARPAVDAGIRTVFLRTGIVLDAAHGALPAMLPAFRAGGGGPMGGGQQYVPWIHIDDLVYAIHFAMTEPGLSGPVLGVGPSPCRQADFAAALGRALGRPAIVPAPAAALRLAMGREMADELLLAGQRCVPKALLDAGFRFSRPELGDALASLLG